MAENLKNLWAEDDGDPELAKDFHKMYKEELKHIPACSEKELLKLLEERKNGDGQTREKTEKRIVEGHLYLAAELAESYMDKELPIGDLVQEANMALLMFAREYEDGDFKAQLTKRIQKALEEALEEQDCEQKTEEEILARVNVLKDISAGMADELGREATVTELAERMKMTEEEIKDIMKLTLDAMSVSGGAG